MIFSRSRSPSDTSQATASLKRRLDLIRDRSGERTGQRGPILVGLVALITAGLFSSNASALTVHEVLDQCNSAEGSPEFNFCIGYVGSLSDAMLLVGVVIEHSDQPKNFNLLNRLGMCRTTESTYQAARQIFVNWAQKHPEKWSNTAMSGVAAALQEVWPCPK